MQPISIRLPSGPGRMKGTTYERDHLETQLAVLANYLEHKRRSIMALATVIMELATRGRCMPSIKGLGGRCASQNNLEGDGRERRKPQRVAQEPISNSSLGQ